MLLRRRYRRRSLKLRLRKETVYTMFSFGLIVVGALLFLSFFSSPTEEQEVFTTIRILLEEQFGALGLLAPFVPVLFGFLFLRLRLFVSRPNVAIGFFIFFVSTVAIAQSGLVGKRLFLLFSDMLTSLGAYTVSAAGIFVGIVVFFDTSIDEVVEAGLLLINTINRMIPKKLIVMLFKTKKPFAVRGKPLTIRGEQKDIAVVVPQRGDGTAVLKKEPLLSEKLVSNPLGSTIWEYPPLSLLSEVSEKKADRGDIKRTASIIEKTLQSFGIEARVVEVNLGPAVTQYALEIALGTKVSKITALSNDLALATEAPTGQIRIETPIPGRSLVGIEIPNRTLEIVPLKTMLVSQVMQKARSKLTVALGLDVSGAPVVTDIARMPHVLIAGTTGSGKSVLINSLICSLLFRAAPTEVKLILIDPKRVELNLYNKIPHLLTPVIVDIDKILSALKWAMNEMDRRYKIFAEAHVRNIDSYNELSGFQALPSIAIIVDELADLMAYAPVEVEDAIARLAQMARATGIHLVVSTQRPSVDVITGLIKANIPCRIAFNVSSMIDSRVIIDTPGAEKLLGRGDMLYVPPDQAKPTRIQGAYILEKDVKRLTDYLREKAPVVQYTEEITTQQVTIRRGGFGPSAQGKDPLFEEAIRVVCSYDRASASLLQRRLSIGYARAARILDQLEEVGIVGPGEGSKPRDVLVRNAEEFLSGLHEG